MATSASYWGNYSDKDQPTLNTVADYINDARTLLQDMIPEYRYDDPSLLRALNVALLETRRIRPDLFVFNLDVNGQVQAFTAVDDTYVDDGAAVPAGASARAVRARAGARSGGCAGHPRDGVPWRCSTLGLIGRALGGVAGGSGPERGPATRTGWIMDNTEEVASLLGQAALARPR